MLDLTKPVQLRNGTPCRVICTDFKGWAPSFSVLVATLDLDGAEQVMTCRADGSASGAGGMECARDVINKPEVVKLTVYKATSQNVYAENTYMAGDDKRTFTSEYWQPIKEIEVTL